MKHWHATNTLDFPTGTVSGRFGASVMFVAYDRLLQRWVWVQGGGVEERIAEPPQIFVDDEWACQHTLPVPRAKVFDKPLNIRQGKAPRQMEFGL